MYTTYFPFNRFLFRTPLLDISNYHNQSLYTTPLFDESLWLASPYFFQEKHKMEINRNFDSSMQISLYKYLTRASTRCTPFGLFAGCSVGKIGDKTEIVLVSEDQYRRVTRLDMNFLCALVQKIETDPQIQKQLKFYPNDSIYHLGGKLRYVEYYYAGTHRIHQISSVDISEYLIQVLKEAKVGKSCSELAYSLVDDEISLDEANDFIEELIHSQLLKSELEISVTGGDTLDKLMANLKPLDHTEAWIDKLSQIKNRLNRIDQSVIGQSLPLYEQIINIIRETGIEYELNYLFQTDLFKPTLSSTISAKTVEAMSDLLSFLNKITPSPQSTNMNEFYKAYYERYGDRTMPLLQVLDTELGIGYIQNKPSETSDELIRGVVIKRNNKQNTRNITWSDFDSQMLKKYIQCIRDHKDVIVLDDNDIKPEKTAHWEDLPVTLSIMCSITEKGIYIKSIGGSCAANILGRFCHLDPRVESLVREITQKEQELNPDAILAEIVHLPESRVGNILLRPVIRDYEIHYLAKPGVESNYRIPLEDLLVSIKNQRVVLTSKKLGKEILPRLTTAHNYFYNSLPVYQFLSELQTQDLRSSLYFKWNDIFKTFDYLPQVRYQNFILSRQQWKIEITSFSNITDKDLEEYLIQKKLPARILIPEGDNELFIDFNDPTGKELFRSILKKRKSVWVEEFLYPERMITQKKSGTTFCNEFIFPYYKMK